MKRTLFIDGSNLYGGLAELLEPGQYVDFAQLLKVIEKDLPVNLVRFYGTYMQIDPSKSAAYALSVKAQKAFFDSAKNHPKVKFVKGHFSGSGKEKGVDVMLAVDMALGAATNLYDEAVIMTGDADLTYGAKMAKSFKKPVHLAALGSRFPFGAVKYIELCFVYDFQNFFVKETLPNYRHKPENLVVRELKGKLKILQI